MYPLFIYFGIILLSALHGYKPLPGSKALRGLLLLILRMLPDLTFRNNCSSFQKLEIIKSSLLALGQRDYYPVPTTSCNSQESSHQPTRPHKRYTLPHIRKAIGISQWCVWRLCSCVRLSLLKTNKKQIRKQKTISAFIL